MIKKQNIISILIFINLMLSIYLVYSESKNYSYCIIGDTCDLVQNTQYGYVLGIPVAWIGLIAFTILLLLFYLKDSHKYIKIIYFISITIGALYAIYLIFIQSFILNKFCGICMIIDLIMIIIAVLSFWELRQSLPIHKR